MNGQVYLNISACFYTTLIAFCFFCRKKVNNIETKIYGYLIIVSFLELIIGLVSSLLISYNQPSFLLSLVTRIYFISILSWIFVFTNYMICVDSKINSAENFKKQKVYLLVRCIYILSIILILLLPLNVIFKSGLIYTEGYSFISLVIFAMVLLMICTILGIKNIKRHDKRITPLWILLIVGTIVSIFQIINPQLFLLVPLEVFITSVMYHTIENPDVKMIEQLEIARDQADKANQAKTDFLSSMSHEIRTPLNAIVGFSDCINNSDTLEEAKENAKDIINASKTLLEIVNGILDISKIEAGKLEITNSKYNARSTFEELAKLITPKMNEKGLDFSYYIAPDLPNTLYGDHANIKKVVTNLLSNASKYTDKGFVRYEVNCVNTGNLCKLIISVEDSGRGIKKENIDKLFTKFQRLEEDRNTTIEGTGLGLAITKQLTELMGGKIIVHTVYGEGSKFTIVLPQPIEQEEAKVVEEVSQTTLDLKGVKILIVDDNTLNLKVASKLLERFQADNITCLEDGFKCISEIETGKYYDVILLDDMMPKMSGVETLKKLKEIPNFNTPVIALTANAITGMREKYLAEGFNEYLAKPIEKEELIKVMNKILNQKEKEATYQKQESVPAKPLNKFTVEKSMEEVEELLSVTEELTPIHEDNVQEIEEAPKEPSAIIHREEDIISTKKQFLLNKGIDLEKALELLGDIQMYDMTLKDFVSEADNKWLRIKNDKQTSDLENYAIEVHSLKSDSKYLGFMRLADIAYQHELKSKDKDLNFVNNHFRELEDEYNKVMNIIDEYQSLEKETF